MTCTCFLGEKIITLSFSERKIVVSLFQDEKATRLNEIFAAEGKMFCNLRFVRFGHTRHSATLDLILSQENFSFVSKGKRI